MIKLLEENEDKIQSMGRESFILTKNKYDVEKVNRSILNIINL